MGAIAFCCSDNSTTTDLNHSAEHKKEATISKQNRPIKRKSNQEEEYERFLARSAKNTSQVVVELDLVPRKVPKTANNEIPPDELAPYDLPEDFLIPAELLSEKERDGLV